MTIPKELSPKGNNPREYIISDNLINKRIKAAAKTYNWFAGIIEFFKTLAPKYDKHFSSHGKVKKDHHNTIVEKQTRSGGQTMGTIYLGAIPTPELMKEMQKNRGLVRVSMLTTAEEDDIGYNTEQPTIRTPLFDHGVIDATTGKDIVTKKFIAQLNDIKKEITQGNNVYFHCMAGKSRSFLGVASLLYLHPNLLPKEMDSAVHPPTIAEVTSFIKSRRHKVKSLAKMDGDQAGMLGLMALTREVNRLKEMSKEGTINPEALKRIAQDVGLSLHMPLDRGFRDAADLQEQKDNFAKLYNNIMELSSKATATANWETFVRNMLPGTEEENFTERFAKLKPSEQAHFAILLQDLTKKNKLSTQDQDRIKWCAQQAATQRKKLTTGDQVELLRAFGQGDRSDTVSLPDLGITYTGVARQIIQAQQKSRFFPFKKARVDCYNAGTQLAELYSIAPEADQRQIDTIAKKLKSKEAEVYKQYKKTQENETKQQKWESQENLISEEIEISQNTSKKPIVPSEGLDANTQQASQFSASSPTTEKEGL